jgi:glycosyltransferase involved in cell wall biosynthesis
MACGTAVVTTDVGAVPEFARHRTNALVVQAGDVDGTALAVEELLRDEALRVRLAADGRRTADEWAVSRVAPLFEAALERALSHAIVPRPTSHGG